MSQLPPAGGLEFIVADGLSDDGSRAILQRIAARHSSLKVIDNPERTTPCGLNAALRVARGAIIVRMDAHTEYAPDYIQQCVAVLRETGADNVGGPWVARGSAYWSRAVAAAFQCPWVVGGARGHALSFEGEVDTVYLGCWPKSAFAKFGCFDEEFVRNQDDELNLRITKGGGRIWQSRRIRSWYQPRSSLPALFRQYMQYGYWKVRVIQKHRLPASWRHLVPALFLSAVIVLGLAAMFSKMALLLWLGVLLAYLLVNLAASVASAASGGWRLLPVLPAVVACYHLGYGYGFLRGLWDFGIRRKGGRQSFSALTRS
jgi:succinoglycan biosynthesis protein ExoA